jgi:hypothetical protein
MRYSYCNNHGSAGLNFVYDLFGGSAGTSGFDYLRESFAPVSGNIENFVVRLTAAPGTGNSRTFVFNVAGATLGSVTISDLATTARITGLVGAVTANQIVKLVSSQSGTPAAANVRTVFELDATTDQQHGYAGNIQGISTGMTRYVTPFFPSNVTTAAADAVVPVAAPVTMTALKLATLFSALDPGQGVTATIYLSTDDGANYVPQDGTGGTPNTVTAITNVADNTVVTGSFSLSLARGDLFYIQLVANGTLNEVFAVGTVFTTVNADQANASIGKQGGNTTSSSVANFNNFAYQDTINWSTTEANFVTDAGVTGFTLGDPYVITATAPGGAATRTLHLRVNGVNSSATVVMAGTTSPTVGDGTGQAFVSDGDTFNISHTPSGTPNVTTAPRWTFVLDADLPDPVAVDDTYTTPYETTLNEPADGVLANDDDAGGGAMTAVLVDDVDFGALTLNADGSFDYVPDAGFRGDDVFTYTANTAGGVSNVATVTITVEDPEPPDGGGETGEGTNPTVAEVPTGVLRLFFVMQVGPGSPATIVTGAETTLRDPDSWHGGYKPPILLSVSSGERELTQDGTFRGTELRFVVADVDRRLRTLATTHTISGSFFEYFVVSDTVRYALGEPYRLFGGHVHSHQALPGWKYELVVRDVLSERIAELDDAPRVPPDRLSVADFPGMEAEYEGRAVPIVMGACFDSEEDGLIPQIPQGVIPPVILGQINFSHWGGIDQEVIACIWSQGAVAANGIWDVYYNPPETPDVRILIPLSSYGVDVWTPGMPGWADTGLAVDYVDYPMPLGPTTRRYTPFFVRADLGPLADAFKEGKVLVAANMYGMAENADGTGRYLDDAPRIWQWLIVNQLFSPYKTGDYADVPLMEGGYSIIDTESVEATVTRLRSFISGTGNTHPVGFLLGRDGTQQTLRHILGELCAGVMMEQGINRHGQLMLDVEDVDAEATVTLTDLFDILNGEFSVWVDQTAHRNRLEYVHGRRYVAPSAPPATPPEGEALPAQPLKPYYEWASGLRVMTDDDAIAAFGGRHRTAFFENYVVRDQDVATSVAIRMLQRLCGPAPSFDGPRMFRLTTSWQGLAVELGTVIAITHIEGLGASGYEGTRGRVTKISVDGQAARITIEGRILDGLGSPE